LLDPLPQTRLLARLKRDELPQTGQIDAARRELANALHEISPAYGRELGAPDLS
jgi:hypothetical protein